MSNRLDDARPVPSGTRRRLRLALLNGSLGLALLVGCGEEEQAEVDMARPVVAVPVVISDLEERIEATGELVAKDEAEIASEVPGRITEVLVDEGERVEEGQLLLSIDPERRELQAADARAMLAEAKAGKEEADREWRRQRRLREKGAASRSALERARTAVETSSSRLEAAEARVGVAERAVRDANVRAPFAGLVARRSVSRGEFVSTGQPLFEIVALDPVEVEFHVAERDSARVQEGQRVGVRVAPYPGETFEGEVTVIAPTIDPRTRTLRVKAVMQNADGRLRPGLFARAELGVAVRRNVTLVPEEAVLLRADGQVLYLADGDGFARRMVVETGSHQSGMVEVVSAIPEGMDVIVRGQAALVDGTPVSRRNPDGTPETSALDVADGPQLGKVAR